jgi:hypothetical protein
MDRAYLLLLWNRRENIIHQDGHEFRYSVNASSIRPILGRAVNGLPLGFCLLKPFPGYGVYYVENTQFVRSRSLLEVRVNLLNQNRFGLDERQAVSTVGNTRLACMLLAMKPYLNIGDAERREVVDSRAGNSWRLQVEHGLKTSF